MTSAERRGRTRAPGPQLLLVEDEESIGALVSAYLEQSGYRVAWVRSGEDALAKLDAVRPRLVILDIGLPGQDGFEVCRGIRARSTVPILMLTARDEEPDRVAGLEVGADDYVTKPFSPRELAARVKAVLRRSEPGAARRTTLELGDVVLDPQAREVTVAGEPVELTGKEFDLLAYLLENAGIVVSRDQLLDRVWGMSYAGGTRTVDVHVAQLRRKLGRPDAIRTLRGSGLQGRPSVRLALAARAAVRRDRARRAALARPRARDRRGADAPGGRAEHAAGRLGAVRPARRARARGAPALLAAPLARRSSSDRQDERVVQVPLDGSIDLLPPDRAARLRRGAKLDGTLETDGTRYLYAARLVSGKGFMLLRPASSTTSAWRPHVEGLIVAALATAALAALVAFLLARAIARPVRRVAEATRGLAGATGSRRPCPSRGRASSRCSPRASTRSPSSSPRRARRSGPSSSRSATS